MTLIGWELKKMIRRRLTRWVLAAAVGVVLLLALPGRPPRAIATESRPVRGGFSAILPAGGAPASARTAPCARGPACARKPQPPRRESLRGGVYQSRSPSAA